jgi:hypothetical protein
MKNPPGAEYLSQWHLVLLQNRNDSAIQPLVRDYHAINNGEQVNVRVPSESAYQRLHPDLIMLNVFLDSTTYRESGHTCQSRGQSLVRQ